MSDATRFSPLMRSTVMTLATLRAVAASCDPGVRLLANIRCDDIIRAVDELMPLDEYWPGETQHIERNHLYVRHDWKDGQASDIVLMGVMNAAMHHVPDSPIVGPLFAGEIASATYHVLTGLEFEQKVESSPEPD
jgi:hypothetical protein